MWVSSDPMNECILKSGILATPLSRIALVSPHRFSLIDAALTSLLYRTLAPSPSKDGLPPHSVWLKRFPPVLWANHVYIFDQVCPRGHHHIFWDRLPHMWCFTKCEAADRRQNGQWDGCHWHVYVPLWYLHVPLRCRIQIVVFMIQIITQVTCPGLPKTLWCIRRRLWALVRHRSPHRRCAHWPCKPFHI